MIFLFNSIVSVSTTFFSLGGQAFSRIEVVLDMCGLFFQYISWIGFPCKFRCRQGNCINDRVYFLKVSV